MTFNSTDIRYRSAPEAIFGPCPAPEISGAAPKLSQLDIFINFIQVGNSLSPCKDNSFIFRDTQSVKLGKLDEMSREIQCCFQN